jgi:hypothetical protein
MTKSTPIHEVRELPWLAVFWTVSSWWVLFPLIPLGVFMMGFERVSMAIEFVAFNEVSVLSRLLSAIIDRRPINTALLMSVRFEDVIFYASLVVFSLGVYRVKWVAYLSRLTLALHVLMSAVLVISLAYALQGTNVNTVITVIQVSGIIITVLSVSQVLLIFSTTLIVLLKE